MSVFIFGTVVNAAGVEEYCGIYGGGRFVFPGATFDEQVDNALAFVDELDAGMGDAIQWINTNLTQFAGNPNWADDTFAEFFGDATEIIVNGSVIVDLEAMINAGELSDAASIGEAIGADEGSVFSDALVTAIEAVIAV